jgi:hypothetical protein
MRETFKPDLRYPTIFSNFGFFGLGRFMVAWGVVERELDTAFPIIFRVNPTLATCLYANLGTKAKTDILNSAISTLEPHLGATLTAKCHATLSKINDKSELRTAIAHGQAISVKGPKKSTWKFVRHTARKKPVFIVYPGTHGFWSIHARSTTRLAQEWRALVARIYDRLSEIPDDAFDAPLEIASRYERPTVTRPRRRRPPKRGGSKGRPTTHGQSPRP